MTKRDARALQLDDRQNWQVFWGLAYRLEHCEILAAMNFNDWMNSRFDFCTLERVQASLDEMRLCHEMRAKLRPMLFKKAP